MGDTKKMRETFLVVYCVLSYLSKSVFAEVEKKQVAEYYNDWIDDPKIISDKELLSAFQAVRTYYKDVKPADDCNIQGTLKTLEFLTLREDELLHNKTLKNYKGIHLDCSVRRIRLNKFRRFLARIGYLRDPGTLSFVSRQQADIKEVCNPNDKDGDYGWSVVGLEDQYSDESFNVHNRLEGATLREQQPFPETYFRKFLCFKNSDVADNRCTHTVYSIHRPDSRVEFPLHYLQGETFQFYCRVDPCLYTACADVQPRYTGAFTMAWSVPQQAIINPETAKARTSHTCVVDFGDGEVDEHHYVFDIKKSGGEYQLFPKDGGLRPNMQVVDVVSDQVMKTVNGTKKSLGITESYMKIENVENDNEGYFECIVTDGHGVPSTPTTKLLRHNRYLGASKLHIRVIEEVIGPAAAVAGTAIVLIFIHCFCPLRMEHEDGRVYTKEEIYGTSPVVANDSQSVDVNDMQTSEQA